jgi:hypothetical protein
LKLSSGEWPAGFTAERLLVLLECGYSRWLSDCLVGRGDRWCTVTFRFDLGGEEATTFFRLEKVG